MTDTTRYLPLIFLGFSLFSCAEADDPDMTGAGVATNPTAPAAGDTSMPATAPPPAASPPPLAETAAPPAQTAAPPGEIAAPPAETAAPPTETAAPPAETAAPPAETAPPAATTPPGEVGAEPSACNTTDFSPKCELGPTAAGEEIKKGTACTEADPQCCFRTCGPQSIGWKTETCTEGAYAEGDCQFPPDGDYSCYAVPEAIDATVCPQDGPPQSGLECDVPECTVCNLDDTYLDSGGSSKTGYCICQAPNGDGRRTWSCGSADAWPCQAGQGC